jgi:hypothetical protein
MEQAEQQLKLCMYIAKKRCKTSAILKVTAPSPIRHELARTRDLKSCSTTSKRSEKAAIKKLRVIAHRDLGSREQVQLWAMRSPRRFVDLRCGYSLAI